ncbi:hypothetical protein HDU86_005416 [Geranomyces michiganensis]|nr:hypothetical protein HDU86_005416 [Geranomyces michiganensis]
MPKAGNASRRKRSPSRTQPDGTPIASSLSATSDYDDDINTQQGVGKDQHVDRRKRRAQSPARPAILRRKLSLQDSVKQLGIRKACLQFRRFFFIIGAVIGLSSGLLLQSYIRVHPEALPDMPESMVRLRQLLGGVLNTTDLSHVFGADLLANLTSVFSDPDEGYADFLPGARLAAEGLRAKHPVVLIPGIVSTGLQVWNTAPMDSSAAEKKWGTAEEESTPSSQKEGVDSRLERQMARIRKLLPFLPKHMLHKKAHAGDPPQHRTKPEDVEDTGDRAALKAVMAANRACGQKYFRKRMWGTVDQLKAIMLNKECWLHHMMLNERDGLDPPGVKLRAAQGLDAADYLFPGYWVWAKILSNLGSLGYDSNSMYLASYDWRLSYNNLQKRDLYFTKLKHTIEDAYTQAILGGSTAADARVMVISHSMGATIFLYFVNWARANEGEEWAAKYLGGWVNIAGTVLGTPKSLAMMLSGEMKDTAQLNGMGSLMLENFFSRKQRARLARSWGGLSSMFLYGGERLWGKLGKTAPDEDSNIKKEPSLSAIIEVKYDFDDMERDETAHVSRFQLSAANVSTFVEHSGSDEPRHPYWADQFDYGIATSKKDLQHAKSDPRAWTNPLLTPLPRFHPDFKIVCLYGTGLPAERKYFYKLDGERASSAAAAASQAAAGHDGGAATPGPNELFIDSARQDPENFVHNGVQMTDGDGTVPLLSLGYMCRGGWKTQRYNPGKVKIVTRETKERRRKEWKLQVRGGPGSGDHVDILGNYELTEDILRMVSGHGDQLEDRIHSDIDAIVSRVELPPGLD